MSAETGTKQDTPRIFLGHPCRQQGCHTPAFYRCTGPHGTVWYCLEHGAKYRETMAALGASVHVELVTEELQEPAPAPETTVESWTCINCLAHAELELPASTPIAAVRQQILEQHRELSPACDVIDMRWRLYDRRNAVVR